MSMISKQRIAERLEMLSMIGADPGGGVTRLSFTAGDIMAKSMIRQWMEDAGLKVGEDSMGSLYGRLPGSEPGMPVVMAGSHADTVIQGGRFDGAAGVVTAIEAVRAISHSGGVMRHPVEVVVFTDEEGVRFGSGTIGSKAAAGLWEEEDLYRLQDKDKVSLAQAMVEAGLDPQRLKEAQIPPGSVKAFLEVHIEQGTKLEEAGLPIGIVSGFNACTWERVEIEGGTGHAGTTPMTVRADATVACAEMISLMDRHTVEQKEAVLTVGHVELKPGLTNVIAKEAAFSLDYRTSTSRQQNEMKTMVRTIVEQTGKTRGVAARVVPVSDLSVQECDEGLLGLLREIVDKRPYPLMELRSWAFHDARIICDVAPAAMIFVRSRQGLSHCPEEWSSPEDLAEAAEVLMEAIRNLAE